jgi:hypothetical protein
MKEEFVSFLLVWMIIQTYQLWMRGAPWIWLEGGFFMQ